MSYADIPQALYDAYLNWGNDFVLSSTNDIMLTNGSTLSEQRIIRRLMTNPLDYIWDASYGAGIPSYVGQPESSDNLDIIRSTITSQIFLENTVAQIPQPEIFMQTIQNGLFAQINYTLSPSQQAIVLNFEVSP